jgi:hypothetical protein
MGIHTQIEKSDEGGIDKQSARIAQTPKPPGRGPKRRIKKRDATELAETPGEVNILHERDVRETAELAKNIGFHKERLITE